MDEEKIIQLPEPEHKKLFSEETFEDSLDFEADLEDLPL